MNSQSFLSKVLVLAGTLTLSLSARADWTGAAGDGIYGNPDNWDLGIINHRVINFAANPALKFSNNYGTLNVDNGMVFTSTSAVDFNFWDRNGINISPVFNFTGTNPAAITVDLGVNEGTSQNKFAYLGRADVNMVFDYGGRVAVFNISPSVATPAANYSDTLYLSVTGSNLGGLTKTGGGILNIRGKANQTLNVSGPVTVTGGMLSVVQGSEGYGQTPITTPRISGATEYNIIGQYSALFLHNAGNMDSQLTYTQNLIETSSTITLYSAAFGAGANVAQFVNQSVAKVVLADGRNAIGTNNTSNVSAGNPFVLTIGELVRENYATLNVVGNIGHTGANGALVKVTNDANLLAALIGGDGAAGNYNVSIIPWATSRAGLDSSWNGGWNITSNATYIGTGFVTYDHDLGFRPLASNEYYVTGSSWATLASAGAAYNVRAQGGIAVSANNAITSDLAINALLMDGWDTQIGFKNDATLTVTSGAIMGNGGRLAMGLTTGANNLGEVSSGTNPFVLNQTGIEFYVPLTNSVTGDQPGMIVDTNSATVFWVANSYGGSTLVHGQLVLKHSNALPRTSALHVDSYGLVTVSANGSVGAQINTPRLSGAGTVNFDGNAASATPNQLNIGASGFVGSLEPNAINVGTGGVISPGDASALLQTGTLTLGAAVKSVNFLDGSTLALDIAGNGLSDTLLFSNAAATLNFDPGATIALNFLNGYTPAEGDTWLFATGYDTLNSMLDFSKVTVSGLDPDTYAWDFSGGWLQLSVTAIPEPSAWALLLGGAALLLSLRRRCR